MRQSESDATIARLRPALGLSLLGALALGWAALPGATAQARGGESAYCASLRAQIAQAGSGGGRYRAAATKQRNELARATAYARSLGCDRQQFLFFGEPPPPQCGSLQARIAQMGANLARLQQSEDGGAKAELAARYDSECRARPSNAPSTIFEEIFGPSRGGVRYNVPDDPLDSPTGLRPSDEPQVMRDDDPIDDRAHGGSEAICVRHCDGGFFPVSYSARRSNVDNLNTLCKALCPNTEATLYTKPPWKDVQTAISVDGDNYADHPNALRFQKERVAGCTCKPPGKNWAESLQEAERLLSETHSQDAMVTPEEAEKLSRPLPVGGSSSRRDTKGQSTRREAQAQESLPEAPAAAASAATRDVYRETMGPDGVRRRVRIIAPTL
jgi:hypothetical protein